MLHIAFSDVRPLRKLMVQFLSTHIVYMQTRAYFAPKLVTMAICTAGGATC